MMAAEISIVVDRFSLAVGEGGEKRLFTAGVEDYDVTSASGRLRRDEPIARGGVGRRQWPARERERERERR